MRKLFRLTVMLFFAVIIFGSCRNASQAKKAIEVAKKLSGKTVKASQKGTYVLRYGDDVIHRLDFVKVSCTECNGNGTDTWGDTCEECDGDGFVYKIQTK